MYIHLVVYTSFSFAYIVRHPRNDKIWRIVCTSKLAWPDSTRNNARRLIRVFANIQNKYNPLCTYEREHSCYRTICVRTRIAWNINESTVCAKTVATSAQHICEYGKLGQESGWVFTSFDEKNEFDKNKVNFQTCFSVKYWWTIYYGTHQENLLLAEKHFLHTLNVGPMASKPFVCKMKL